MKKKYQITKSANFVILLLFLSNYCTNAQDDSCNNLDVKLKTINYIDIFSNETYVSEDSYDPGAIGSFFSFSSAFVDAVLPNASLEGILEIDNTTHKIYLDNDAASTVLQKMTGILSLGVIILILTILLPVFGLIYCCCLCCCSNSKKTQGSNTSILILTVLLVICIGLLLFGVATSFSSNEEASSGMNSLATTMNKSSQDIQTFLKSIGNEINLLLLDNSEQFIDNTLDYVTDMGKKVTNNIEECIVHLSDIQKNVKDLNETIKGFKLDELINQLGVLDSEIKTLSSGDGVFSQIEEISNEIKQVCQAGLPNCDLFTTSLDTIGNFKTELPNDQAIKDIKGQLSDLTEIMHGSDLEKINEADNLINEKLDTFLNDGKSKIEDAKTQAKVINSNISKVITDATDGINDAVNDLSTNTNVYVSDYEGYVHIVGVILNIVLLAVVVLLICGLVLGILGSYNGCCSKSIGGSLLKSSALIMYFVSFFVGLLAIVYLIVGTIPTKLVCEPIKDPSSSLVNFLSGLTQDYNVPDLNEMLTSCHNDQSVYKTFQLETRISFDELDKLINVEDIKKKVRINKDTINFDEIFSTDELNGVLNDINKIDFTKITEIKVNTFSSSYNKLIADLTSVPGMDEPLKKLTNSQNDVNSLTETLTTIQESANNVAPKLEEISKTIGDMITNVTTFPDKLTEMSDLTDPVVDRLAGSLQDFVKNRVKYQLINQIGRCGPVSLVINATLGSVCDRILLPMNGQWVSYFWLLCTFVITIIITIMLGNRFKNRDESEDINFRIDKQFQFTKGKPEGKPFKRY